MERYILEIVLAERDGEAVDTAHASPSGDARSGLREETAPTARDGGAPKTRPVRKVARDLTKTSAELMETPFRATECNSTRERQSPDGPSPRVRDGPHPAPQAERSNTKRPDWANDDLRTTGESRLSTAHHASVGANSGSPSL